jgi:DNA-binding cell septation regulator SpoVG
MPDILPLEISEVVFTTATAALAQTGLLGFVSCCLNRALRLDGLTLRRTQDGKLTLSFPARRDARGRQHHFVRPIDDETRREIERQVIEAIRFGDCECLEPRA